MRIGREMVVIRKTKGKNYNMKKQEIVYILIVAVLTICLILGMFSATKEYGSWVTSPVTLLAGLIFALTFGKAFPEFNKMMSKKLLQYSVIGLGFGMTLESAWASGSEGMLITILSVFGTLALGTFIGRKILGVDWQTSYLISSGTAICGGSAIAAVGPVIKAKAESMSVALGVVFILNAIALLIFPYIGDVLAMDLIDFGTWAAIAIHDTSSVVGAGAAYDAMHPELVAQGQSALEVATTVKLTRALWIVIIAVVTPFFFRSELKGDEGSKKPWYKVIPTFIIYFICAILLNTFVFSHFETGEIICKEISHIAKTLITLSLFFIGAGLTRETLKAVGLKPLVQGVALWILISVLSLGYILM